MPTAAQILSSSGVRRATEVVELAGTANLELAAAATLLIKESGGGANVWGHDAASTGGIYIKGSEVTRDAYLAYKARRPQLGAQGVGPCQITWPPSQDAADAAGGCWDWRANCLTGFRILEDNIRRLGTRGGFRAYNGSGPAAEAYADDAMAKLAAWRNRLAAAASEDNAMAMYIRCGDDIAILSGPIFVGLSSPNERQSAINAIGRGAVEQWVERATWNEILRLRNAMTTPS